jgi:glycosyltransferase involved in cell wall biosynthesis
MGINKIKLAVGMPCYNDAGMLPAAIESVLNQTYKDFVLHIFDNCSTDGSYEIAKQYAQQDGRIILHRNSVNIGLAANFNKALTINDCEYVCLKSANDIIYPEFFENTLAKLDTDKDAVVAFSDGEDVKDVSYEQDCPYERVSLVLKYLVSTSAIYGVHRREVIDKLVIFENICGNDHVFLFNIALLGKFLKVEDGLYESESVVRTPEQYIYCCKSSVKTPDGCGEPNIKFIEILLGVMNVINNGYIPDNLSRNELKKIALDIFVENWSAALWASCVCYVKYIGRLKKQRCSKDVILQHQNRFALAKLYLLLSKKSLAFRFRFPLCFLYSLI